MLFALILLLASVGAFFIFKLFRYQKDLQIQIAENAKLIRMCTSEIVILYEKNAENKAAFELLIEESFSVTNNISIINSNSRLNAKKIDEIALAFNEKIKNDKKLVLKLQQLIEEREEDPFNSRTDEKKILN